MIRQPTPEADQYRWWRAALADPRTPRHDGQPQPGFYRRCAVKNGPWLPVCVWLDQPIDPETDELTGDEILRAEQLGWEIDPARHWLSLRPITQEAFEALVEIHRTEARMATTHVEYDVAETPTRPGV